MRRRYTWTESSSKVTFPPRISEHGCTNFSVTQSCRPLTCLRARRCGSTSDRLLQQSKRLAGDSAEEEGHTKAAPSGGPWINTNGGFLRFVRAAAPDASIWLGNLPPKNTIITPEHYVQAICDAAIIGARWIIALDDDFRQRLLKREANAVRDWQHRVKSRLVRAA